MEGSEGSVRRDAALTLFVLVPLAVVAIARAAPLSLTAVGAGVGGTVCLELLLARRRERVRARWADRRVQVAAVFGTVTAGLALTVAVGDWVLTALLAGLCSYLLLLGAVVVWRRG